jgi:hypothetical protein
MIVGETSDGEMTQTLVYADSFFDNYNLINIEYYWCVLHILKLEFFPVQLELHSKSCIVDRDENRKFFIRKHIT